MCGHTEHTRTGTWWCIAPVHVAASGYMRPDSHGIVRADRHVMVRAPYVVVNGTPEP